MSSGNPRRDGPPRHIDAGVTQDRRSELAIRLRERVPFKTMPAEHSGASRQKLTDYVAHVACDSLLPVEAVVNALLDWPARSTPGMLPALRHPFASGQQLSLVNAHGQTARFWTSRLERLTGQRELAALTFLPLSDVLRDPLGLVSCGRRWCPVCLQEDLLNGTRVYERLIWSLRLVTVCPFHSVPLTHTCPACRYAHRTELYRRTVSGFCAHCDQWLGRSASDYRGWLPQVGTGRERDKWIAAQFAALLDLPAESTYALSRAGVASMFDAGIRDVCDGKASEFAKLCGRSKSSVSEWRAGVIVPSITTLLSLCATFQIPLVEWLQGSVAAWATVRNPLRYPGGRTRHRACVLKRDWAEIERQLIIAADRDDYSESWASTAARFAIDASALRRRFPDLASRIANKAREARTQTKTVRQVTRNAVLADQFRRAVNTLVRSGVMPTRRSIDAELTRRGIVYKWSDYPLMSRLRDEVVRAALRDRRL